MFYPLYQTLFFAYSYIVTFISAYITVQFSSVQSLSRVRLFVTPWIFLCVPFLEDSLFLISSWNTGTSRAACSSQDWDHGRKHRLGFLSVTPFSDSLQWPCMCSVQSLSRVRLFATPWIAARQASLSITSSQSSLKLMSIELVMPSSHLILYRPLLLLPSIPLSIRVFSSESTFRMRWPKYWSFSFIISPTKEHPGLISIRMD